MKLIGWKDKNQIDHVLVNIKCKSSMMDVRVIKGADVNNDHCLLRCKIILRSKTRKENQNNEK